MVLSPESLRETTRRFLSDRPLILVTGVPATVAGLAVVNAHNVWSLDWRLIITLFGWALVVGGGVRILAPGVVARVGAQMLEGPLMVRAAGALWFLLGAFLAFLAFEGYA